MGWPSTENEFSAWSPSPWNIPFESAVTPGVDSVTSELSPDDWLSSGICANDFLSMSVSIFAALFTRSCDVTCTVVVAAPRLIVTGTVIGVADCTFTSFASELKPVMLTVMWYELYGTFVKRKLPELSVFVVRSNWLTGFSIVTVAPGRTAPVGSLTVPEMVPDPAPAWAAAGKLSGTAHEKEKRKRKAPRRHACMHDLHFKCEMFLFACWLQAKSGTGGGRLASC